MEKQKLEEELSILEKQKEEVMNSLKLLDEKINSVKEKINDIEKEQNIKQDNKKSIEKLKLVVETDKKNMENNYVSNEVFSKKIIDYFLKNHEDSTNVNLDIKDRIKARMNTILAEYYMTCMTDSVKNIITFDNFFASEYRSLSYEYGKLIGLTDEKIINRGILENNDLKGYVLYELMREGRDINDILDNYYIKRENNSIYYAVRDENGEIVQPRIRYAKGMTIYKTIFSPSERDLLNANGIKTDYYYEYFEKPGKVFDSFLENYYKQIGYEKSTIIDDEDESNFREIQPEYIMKNINTIAFKCDKDRQLYDSLMQSAKDKKPTSSHK